MQQRGEQQVAANALHVLNSHTHKLHSSAQKQSTIKWTQLDSGIWRPSVMLSSCKCSTSTWLVLQSVIIINANLSDCCLLVHISYPKNTSLAHRSAAKVAQVKRVDCVTFSTVGLGRVAQHWQLNNTRSSNREMLGGRWKKNTVCKLLTQSKYCYGSRLSPPQQALELVDLPNERDTVNIFSDSMSSAILFIYLVSFTRIDPLRS